MSVPMDTIDGEAIKEKDPAKRRALISAAGDSFDSWSAKRMRMKDVCINCHSSSYVDGYYQQYDEFIHNYNQKFASPGLALMALMKKDKIRTGPMFDEKIEWVWFEIWHHEGRRGRHGAAMMAPDYAHWHGMYEVAEHFYNDFLPLALEMCDQAEERGNEAGAAEVRAFIAKLQDRPEHKWADVEKNELRKGQNFEFDK